MVWADEQFELLGELKVDRSNGVPSRPVDVYYLSQLLLLILGRWACQSIPAVVGTTQMAVVDFAAL